jgi:hypothetical protein
MNKTLLIGAFLLGYLSAQSVNAGCIGTVVMGECHGTEVDHVDGSDSNTQSRYETNSGTEYQYDRNDPGEDRDYGYDRDAQRRDQMSADPRRETDRDTGQYGGGIYDD